MTEMNDAEEMTEELQEQANYAAVESAKDRLEEKRQNIRRSWLDLRSDAGKTQAIAKAKVTNRAKHRRNRTKFREKVAKQINDAKHVMAIWKVALAKVAKTLRLTMKSGWSYSTRLVDSLTGGARQMDQHGKDLKVWTIMCFTRSIPTNARSRRIKTCAKVSSI